MLFVEFTADEIQQLGYWRYHHPEPRVQRKYEILWLKSQGLPHGEIARLAGVNPRTVQRVLNEFLEGGLERVEENRYQGFPSELNAHADSVKASFERQPPATIAEARHRIEKLTGIVRSETQVRAFLKRIGMRRLKLGGVPGKVDKGKQKEQREFLEHRLEPALDEAERGERKIFSSTPPTLCMERFSAMSGLS
jgi:transposase